MRMPPSPLSLPQGDASRIAQTLPSGRLPGDTPGAWLVLGARTVSSLASPLPQPCYALCRKSGEHHIWGVINPAGTGCSGLAVPGWYQRACSQFAVGPGSGPSVGRRSVRPGPLWEEGSRCDAAAHRSARAALGSGDRPDPPPGAAVTLLQRRSLPSEHAGAGIPLLGPAVAPAFRPRALRSLDPWPGAS